MCLPAFSDVSLRLIISFRREFLFAWPAVARIPQISLSAQNEKSSLAAVPASGRQRIFSYGHPEDSFSLEGGGQVLKSGKKLQLLIYIFIKLKDKNDAIF